MGTSADRDDRDEDEKDDAEEEEAAKPADKPAAASSARDDEDDDEEEEEEAKPADKRPAAKSAGKASPSPAGRGARGPGAVRARPVSPAQGGSLGKSVLLFVVIVVGLGAGFAILGREAPQEANRPKWKAGDVADVEVTLVKSDNQDLACAAEAEVAGKHCAFEAMNKPWSKGGSVDDKAILKPYTTTDRVQFVAAGLWSQPALAPGKLPATRFSVKCKLKVEGTIKNVAVRWEQTGQWYPNNEWYAGSLTDCKLSP